MSAATDYIKPEDVRSPKRHWRLTRVLHDGGAGGWSAAEGQWDNGDRWDNVLAIRWNGGESTEIGNPQSRGLPTWFIVPKELEDDFRKGILAVSNNKRPE